MDNKKIIIANFNIVFGKDEQPLLKYFDTIIFPAFQKKFKNVSGDNEFEFMNVQVIDSIENSLALTGIIVKKTDLKIQSKFNEAGELIETDESYPTAPFSSFVIYLKNHRMALVKNQKGSPDLRNFSSTFAKMLSSYIRSENKDRKEKNLSSLPSPEINIVGIPMRESIEAALKRVKKVNRLTLRFYPLNGDIDFSGLFEGLTSEVRKKVGSKTGSVVLNSPTSIDGIIEVVGEAQGTIDPLFKVTYPNKTKGTISNSMISENMEIAIDKKENVNSELQQIVDKTKNIESLKFAGGDNGNIYNKYKNKIIQFIQNGK